MKPKNILALLLGTFALNCNPVFTYKNGEDISIMTAKEVIYFSKNENTYINFSGAPEGIAVLINDFGNDGRVDQIAFSKPDKTPLGKVYFFGYNDKEYKNWKREMRKKAKEFCDKNQKKLDELGIKNPYK